MERNAGFWYIQLIWNMVEFDICEKGSISLCVGIMYNTIFNYKVQLCSQYSMLPIGRLAVCFVSVMWTDSFDAQHNAAQQQQLPFNIVDNNTYCVTVTVQTEYKKGHKQKHMAQYVGIVLCMRAAKSQYLPARMFVWKIPPPATVMCCCCCSDRLSSKTRAKRDCAEKQALVYLYLCAIGGERT